MFALNSQRTYKSKFENNNKQNLSKYLRNQPSLIRYEKSNLKTIVKISKKQAVYLCKWLNYFNFYNSDIKTIDYYKKRWYNVLYDYIIP